MSNTPVKHPHADLILIMAQQLSSGELAAGWWRWEGSAPRGIRVWMPAVPTWHMQSKYRYTMTSLHPDYVAPAPKLKLIDMMALPKGSMVAAEGLDFIVLRSQPGSVDYLKTIANVSYIMYAWPVTRLRIAEQKAFTYWGGGECPVPDGVHVECARRRCYGQGDRAVCVEYINVDRKHATTHWPHDGTDTDIIAYRIIGVAPGWTDDPELAK